MTEFSVVPLNEVAAVFNGKTPAKSEQRSEGHPVLKIRNVNEEGVFKGRFDNFVDQELADKFRQKWVCIGDSLILNAAHNADYVGSKTFLAGETVVGSLATGEWMIIRPSQDLVLPEYVNFWLRSQKTRVAVRSIVKGIHLYPKDMAQLEIQLLPVSEQRRIVDLLSRAEGIVRLRREAEQKAAELIPALFLELFGDPSRNPKRWPSVLLPDVLSSPFKNGLYFKKEQYAPNDSRDGVEMVHMSDAFNEVVVRGKLKRVLADQKQVEQYQLGENDLLIARRSLNFEGAAKPCRVPQSEEPLLFESSFIRLTPDQSRVDTQYLFGYLTNEGARKAFVRPHINGINVYGINQDGLSRIPVLLPPMELQRQFAETTESVRGIVAQQKAALEKAQAAFDALLHQAFAR